MLTWIHKNKNIRRFSTWIDVINDHGYESNFFFFKHMNIYKEKLCYGILFQFISKNRIKRSKTKVI